MSAETMREVVEAFAQADLRPLFEAIAEDVVWKSGSTEPGIFLFGGTYTGRFGVLEVTSLLSTGYIFRRIIPKEIVSSGEVVWGLFQAEGDYYPGGGLSKNPFAIELAIRWRVHEGKIVEHQSF